MTTAPKLALSTIRIPWGSIFGANIVKEKLYALSPYPLGVLPLDLKKWKYVLVNNQRYLKGGWNCKIKCMYTCKTKQGTFASRHKDIGYDDITASNYGLRRWPVHAWPASTHTLYSELHFSGFEHFYSVNTIHSSSLLPTCTASYTAWNWALHYQIELWMWRKMWCSDGGGSGQMCANCGAVTRGLAEVSDQHPHNLSSPCMDM